MTTTLQDEHYFNSLVIMIQYFFSVPLIMAAGIGELVKNRIHMSLGSDAHVLTEVGDILWGMEMLHKYNAEYLQFIKE
jgi:imidazolonepropionase-like amidohydrolase